MIKHPLRHAFVFVFTLFLPFFLFASDQTYSEQHAIKIESCRSKARAPTILTDYWEARTCINFENGLYGFKKSYWKFESQAQEMVNIDKRCSGNVNIIYDYRPCLPFGYDRSDKPRSTTYFSLVQENKSYKIPITLWVNKRRSFLNLPKIASITENIEVETTNYWLWEAKTSYYVYVIELSDGTKWLTPKYTKQWDYQSILDNRVLLLGNSQHPFLVNIDEVFEEEYSIIEPTHCIKDLEQI